MLYLFWQFWHLFQLWLLYLIQIYIPRGIDRSINPGFDGERNLEHLEMNLEHLMETHATHGENSTQKGPGTARIWTQDLFGVQQQC